jgi:hypothetical protein
LKAGEEEEEEEDFAVGIAQPLAAAVLESTMSNPLYVTHVRKRKEGCEVYCQEEDQKEQTKGRSITKPN